MIAFTHVRQVWREIFVSRSSLWTNFGCESTNKARVYLERSRSSPIDLRLESICVLFPHDPFLQIIPQATGRLRSLYVRGTSQTLQSIIARLSCPAALLERLTIDGCLYTGRPITLRSQPPFSTETSPRCAGCVSSTFTRNYLGGI